MKPAEEVAREILAAYHSTDPSGAHDAVTALVRARDGEVLRWAAEQLHNEHAEQRGNEYDIDCHVLELLANDIESGGL